MEVTKFGIHLVFEQDVEDLKQTMAGSSSYRMTPCEDDLDDSQEGTSIDIDVSHPKRRRLPNLIESVNPHLGN